MAAVQEFAPVVPNSLRHLFAPMKREMCQRCSEKVYQMEKLGPVNEVIFHKQCFKCAVCDQHLTLKTYFTNHADFNDKEIYCVNDCPKYTSAGLDAQALGIRNALKSPQSHMNARPSPGWNDQMRGGMAPKVGADAMYIAHPMNAQDQYQRKYKQNAYEKHHYPAYLARTKEKILVAQVGLERLQREEEDRLLDNFLEEKKKEDQRVKQLMAEEWEIKLKELTEKFDKDMEKRTTKKSKNDDTKAMTIKFEQEKDNLKKNLTVRHKEKKEMMTLRLQKEQQAETAELVSKHSHQMLELLKIKQEELKQEMRNELGDGHDDSIDSAVGLEEAMAAISLPTELPDPHPPACRKRDLYYDPSVFKELDEDVFRVAESDQATFTELVMELTKHCLTDLQKARAIFRWITVKDLNVLEFDEDENYKDTPMGLLRGIKFGTETYHTLFMRLCSYAGLACVEIKGHSKSVGYEPGMKIREDTFQNTWNAVLIDGDWWPVQCNWGARHLVLNKDVQPNPVQEKNKKKQDKIRYQYDEHYFLTDPDEFIQEFWAQDPEWQLMEIPITLEQFESMPFVRSVFFHYALEFDRQNKAVLYTDNKGGTEVKIKVPHEFTHDLVFHYQIRFADRERRHETEFRGAKLERFVFHSLVDGFALFSVHVPAAASYFLEIFANKINETNKIGEDPNATMMPFRLKCACKFKIVCEELVGKMHPLPNCASGEWGPSKGQRHFGIRAITHSTGVINVDDDTEVRFKLPRSLHFLCKLRMNGVEDHLLEKYISHSVHDTSLTIRVKPPQAGQYGLDIYARPEDAVDNHTLAHACKYLLNVTRVSEPVDLPVSKVDPSTAKMSKDKWGPSPAFDDLGLKLISHKEATIDITEGELTIELGITDAVKTSYHFIREPDDDCRDKVLVKDKGDRLKFVIHVTKPGNYLLAVYARRKKDSENNMANVYNYMIRYTPAQGDDTLNKRKNKGKSMFKK